MKDYKKKKLARRTIKVGIIGIISLLLLIPLSMIENIICERENAQKEVVKEVSESYADMQTVFAPVVVADKFVNSDNDSASAKKNEIKKTVVHPKNVDYKVEVAVDVLKRSIYRVLVYNSKISINGTMPLTNDMIEADKCALRFSVSDYKGISSLSQITFGGQSRLF